MGLRRRVQFGSGVFHTQQMATAAQVAFPEAATAAAAVARVWSLPNHKRIVSYESSQFVTLARGVNIFSLIPLAPH